VLRLVIASSLSNVLFLVGEVFDGLSPRVPEYMKNCEGKCKISFARPPLEHPWPAG